MTLKRDFSGSAGPGLARFAHPAWTVTAGSECLTTMQERDAEQRAAALDRNYVFSDQIGFLLRRAYQRHLAIFQSRCSEAQLTSVQFSAMCALRDGGPLSQAELVTATGIDQATIRGIVSRLKKRRLIALSKDAGDARKVIILLTPAGAELLTRVVPAAYDVTELTFGKLNPGERAALVFTLRRMLED